MRIVLDFKTPSVNHLYFNYRNVRILTKEARELKKKIIEQVEDMDLEFDVNDDTQLAVDIFVHENWFSKSGNILRKDVANREKFLIDAIFDALKIDDKHIFSNCLYKVQDEKKEFCVINITKK
jgi:Holliday junction resolvase RusA-like endonuclease